MDRALAIHPLFAKRWRLLIAATASAPPAWAPALSAPAATLSEVCKSPSCGCCHTARVGGYAIEGHVPVREVRRLLAEKPQAVGLAVPAMPLGSPGMDGPAYGGRRDAYDVLLVRKDGSASVYRSYT